MSVFSPGLRLHYRFTLVARIGTGGMSEVWRATDELLGREVAVKALLTPLAAEPGLREATWREAARVGRQVAAALAAAHRLGVVHRDVKPGNVMLTDSGVKVLDFGIAAVAGRPDADLGQLVGTPRYAAPERLDPSAPAQPASDVYSLGVLLYEALVGRPPAAPRDWSEAAAVHQAGLTVPRLPLSQLPELPEEVARLGAACLSPDPGLRPSAGQVASVLAGATGEGEASTVDGAGGPPTVRSWGVPAPHPTRVDDAPAPVTAEDLVAALDQEIRQGFTQAA